MNYQNFDVVLSVGMESFISYWDFSRGVSVGVVKVPNSRPINCISRFNEKLVCCGTRDQRVVFVNVLERRFSRRRKSIVGKHWSSVTAIEPFPSSQNPKFLLSGAFDCSIYIYNTEKEELVTRSKGHLGCILDIVSLRGTPFFASSSMDKKIKIWDLEYGGRCVNTIFPGHVERANGLCYNETRKLLFSCSSDKTIKVWGINGNGLREKRIEKPSITIKNDNPILCIDQFEDYCLSGDLWGNIKLWDIRNPKSACCHIQRAHGHSIWCIKFDVTSLLFSSIGKTIQPRSISCSSDCTIRSHDLLRGQLEVKMRTSFPVYSIVPMGNYSKTKSQNFKEVKERMLFLLDDIMRIDSDCTICEIRVGLMKSLFVCSFLM